ncbi:hypothetical protein MMC14_005365 [Varicellaria rhodocarpa]|nr:hypothetical protein [Varicellaria rhodocarpa]
MASSKTIILITGANQGIGFETAANLLVSSSAYHVLLGSRDIEKGTSAVARLNALPIKGSVSSIQIDVTDDISVDAAAKQVLDKYDRLDILVNNTGIFSKNPSARNAFREVLAVNCVGAVSVTEAFLPLLRKSAAPRLIFVSSSVGSITHASDPESRYYAPSANEYRASKSALNMLMIQYWVKLGKDGFKHGADPRLIATNFVNAEAVRKRGALEPHVGGERVATVVRGERDEDVGKLCGEYGISPW